MKLEYRLWLIAADDENKIFGEGPEELLINVDRYGSLRKAAATMNMSYSKAWGVISKIESQLGIKLLEKKIGGANGGGSTLTPIARDLLDRYFKIREELDVHILTLQEKYLGDFYK